MSSRVLIDANSGQHPTRPANVALSSTNNNPPNNNSKANNASEFLPAPSSHLVQNLNSYDPNLALLTSAATANPGPGANVAGIDNNLDPLAFNHPIWNDPNSNHNNNNNGNYVNSPISPAPSNNSAPTSGASTPLTTSTPSSATNVVFNKENILPPPRALNTGANHLQQVPFHHHHQQQQQQQQQRKFVQHQQPMPHQHIQQQQQQVHSEPSVSELVAQQGGRSYYRPIQPPAPTNAKMDIDNQQQQQQQRKRPPTSTSRTAAANPENRTHTGLTQWRRGQGFKQWEQALLKNPEVRRKADAAQLYFLDYYFDLISYVGGRNKRLQMFKDDVSKRGIQGNELMSEWLSYTGRERVYLRKRRTKVRVSNFHIICQIGQGGYGEVFLARKRDTSQVLALKRMKKRTLHKMDEVRHVLIERDILTATATEWLVRLLYAFQDLEHVYLAMEYVPGGDFRTLLNNSGVLKEEHAKFYMSEMLCSVDELHRLGYIHRDLKPENFLIDSTGHIKLTDFGLAAGAVDSDRIDGMRRRLDGAAGSKIVWRSTEERREAYRSIRAIAPRTADSVVGSPDYMAPETLRGESYTHTVDYWSLGAMLFEFLAGYPPFAGATSDETWTNLRNWTRTLRRPHYEREEDQVFNLSDAGWEAISRLVTHRENRCENLEQVGQLAFFKGIRWGTELRQRNAPFVPALDSDDDAGYFDDFGNEEDMAKYADVKAKQRQVDGLADDKDSKANRAVWVGFTFKPRSQVDDAALLGYNAMDDVAGDSEDEDDELYCMF